MAEKGLFRKIISYSFGLVSLVALAVFNEAISALATKRGWDQVFISGWKLIADVGWGSAVSFIFFALGGATLALWAEVWMREKRDAKMKLEQSALSCTARFTFTTSAEGKYAVVLDGQSENVAYWAWYLNNGGTMRNVAVLIFVEFEKKIPLPEVFAHSTAADEEWRQFASTDRFMFVDLKGWPSGEVVLQAFDSRALGLDRRSELQVWRKFAPVSPEASPSA